MDEKVTFSLPSPATSMPQKSIIVNKELTTFSVVGEL
jgi:hypothetical protein